ncbi:metallophosphoesterase family protein [Oceaniglobus roseus]|uniref:metallophosphoesterase family protein n=1 Tax=Oceaniglobus roseus TaxID=1737570 RepID=UPI000C7F6E59|nr:metallophosphoesterase family protein [Kandeliimicrobium roseum]
MKRLVHLSDLHFGRDRPELVKALAHRINDLAPDMVAISGDLTQRARNSQFEAARAFIDMLAPPVLSVPGNHDVPLDNLYMRLVAPWRRYRRWIAQELEPAHVDDEVMIIGINTVNRFNWQRGWFTKSDIRRVRASFEGDKSRIRILVVHHPLEHLPGESKQLMKGSAEALEALASCGTDIVLSGHLHSWSAAPYAEVTDRHSMLQVQAGTGLSTRVRGEENDFNLLTLKSGMVRVERFVADAEGRDYVPQRAAAFRLGPAGWQANGG